jgi:hypothetical protein
MLNQDVPLLADPSFGLAGKAEDPLRQIEFCEQQCTLRSTPLAPATNLSTVARQIPSMSAEPQSTSLLQAQLLRLAKDVCDVPSSGSPEWFLHPGLSRMLENCMSVFQSGAVVWDPVTNAYKRR